MDKNQKRFGKEKDCRTMEYLELKYDTDIQCGLTLAKVRQKQRSQKWHKNSITKEKKWIWLTYLKQECQNPLFFFFLYLCTVSIVLPFTQKVKVIVILSCLFFFFFKVEKAFRYRKAHLNWRKMYASKAIALRANTFQCVQINNLVKGDIIRLKRGEKVPLDSISLEPPYKQYKQGAIFAENTGRAIVTQQEEPHFLKNRKTKEQRKKQADLYVTEEKNIEDYRENYTKNYGKNYIKDYGESYTENYTENAMLQEVFARQGIYFQPDFFKKTTVEEKSPIIAVGFDETYFPSRFQIEKFRLFVQQLKKTGVEWFFFTSQDRETAIFIGKQTGIIKEKREVIDKKQFLLLKNVALQKQIESIRIYCGLSETEKRQVIAMWKKQRQTYSEESLQKQGRILLMSDLNHPASEKITENCVYACCNGGNQKSDIWFKKNWRDALIKYLTGENIWRKFFENIKKWETQIVASLCIFMLLLILLSLYIPGRDNIQKTMQSGILVCVLYILSKEIAQEIFRKWALRKLNSK